MSEKTRVLTNLHPTIKQFQEQLLTKYTIDNQQVKPGQIVLVGSSLMEIFPIEKMQQEQNFGLDKIIYNRGIRATTTADLLAHLDTQIINLSPSKLFINIGSNDIGFGVLEATFLANYSQILTKVKSQLLQCEIYVMAYYPINTTTNFGEEPVEHQALFKTRSNTTLTTASEQVHQQAIQHQCHFINVNQHLTDANGDLRAELTFDGAHMLPAGYEIVLNNLSPYLS